MNETTGLFRRYMKGIRDITSALDRTGTKTIIFREINRSISTHSLYSLLGISSPSQSSQPVRRADPSCGCVSAISPSYWYKSRLGYHREVVKPTASIVEHPPAGRLPPSIYLSNPNPYHAFLVPLTTSPRTFVQSISPSICSSTSPHTTTLSPRIKYKPCSICELGSGSSGVRIIRSTVSINTTFVN